MILWCLTAWAQDPGPSPEEVVVWPEGWADEERTVPEADDAPQTGVYSLNRRDIDATPGALGDVARALHTLPGVVADSDVAAGFHVRGGEQREVVFVLDRVPLDNPFHLAGFNSLFNPDRVKQVRFYASAAPADVPSATSAVVEVSTGDGTGAQGLDAAVELGVIGARFMARGAVDEAEHLTVALAARRSWVEGYVEALKGLGVLDRASTAPEFSELSGRVAWHPSAQHRVMATAMRAADSLRLVDSPDPAQFEVDGALDLRSVLTLVSLDHRYQREGTELQTTLAWTRDRSVSQRDLERDTLLRDTLLNRQYARTDLSVAFSEHTTVQVGADASRFVLEADGSVQDTREFPTWAQGGIGAFGFQVVEVDPLLEPWSEASAYVQTEMSAPTWASRPDVPLVPAVKLRMGMRVTAAGLTGEVLPSPRAGLSLPLPTATVPKVSVGLYQRAIRDPFLLDPDYGSPLRAERSRHWVVGVDQALPLPGGHGLVRVEAYDVRATDLVVNADGPSDEPFTNEGSGHTQGVDVMLVAKAEPVGLRLTYGWLDALRSNPRNTSWPVDVRPAQDQQHSLSVAGDLQAGPWLLLARYAMHSGRPTSGVRLLDAEFGSIQLDCLNCARIGPTHAVDVRAEWARETRHIRWTVALELLNVGNIRSPYLPVHEVIGSQVRTTSLDHLPMRPLLSVRADL